MYLSLGITTGAYLLVVGLIGYRIHQIKKGEVLIARNKTTHLMSWLEIQVDRLAFCLVNFLKEVIWHSYTYLIKFSNLGFKLVRRRIHKLERRLTKLSASAEKRREQKD